MQGLNLIYVNKRDPMSLYEHRSYGCSSADTLLLFDSCYSFGEWVLSIVYMIYVYAYVHTEFIFENFTYHFINVFTNTQTCCSIVCCTFNQVGFRVLLRLWNAEIDWTQYQHGIYHSCSGLIVKLLCIETRPWDIKSKLCVFDLMPFLDFWVLPGYI